MQAFDPGAREHALDLEAKLPGIHFRHQDRTRGRGGFAQRLFRKRPQRDRAEQAGAHAMRAAQFDGAVGGARRDAYGDNHDIGVVAMQLRRRIDHVAM